MSIVPSTVDTLSQYAETLLGICEDALATTDAGAPSNVYMDASIPALDCCPELCVVALPLGEDTTSPLAPTPETALRTTFGNVILATYAIFATRCAAVPQKNGQPPTPAEKSAVARMVQQDGWALWNGVRHAVANGEIFDTCTGVYFDGVRILNAQGGCVGVIMTVRAMIPGIANDSST
jgi:hypothetical protein